MSTNIEYLPIPVSAVSPMKCICSASFFFFYSIMEKWKVVENRNIKSQYRSKLHKWPTTARHYNLLLFTTVIERNRADILSYGILCGIILTSLYTFFTYSVITVPWRIKSFVSPAPACLHPSLVLSFLASSFWPLGLVSVVIISGWMTECLQETAYGCTALTDYLPLLYCLPWRGVCYCVKTKMHPTFILFCIITLALYFLTGLVCHSKTYWNPLPSPELGPISSH